MLRLGPCVGSGLDCLLTCVASQGGGGDDRFVLAEVRALAHVVLEGTLGLVVVKGTGVLLRVKAVVRGHTLQTAEGRLAAPGLRQAVTTLEAVDALKRVLTT